MHSNKFTLESYKEEIKSFYNRFESFEPLLLNGIKNFKNVQITKSVDVLVRKFGYFYPDPNSEINEIKKFYYSEEDNNDYSEYLPFFEFYESVTGKTTALYLDCIDNGYFDLPKRYVQDNYRIIRKELGQKYNMAFHGPSESLDEQLNDVIMSMLSKYFWVRKFLKSPGIEKVIDFLVAGGIPCGFKLNKGEDRYEGDIDFLVYVSDKRTETE